MNIIIPVGGKGKRFSDFNYILPKPLIKSLGKSIIIRCIESLTIHPDDVIYIPYRSDLDRYNFKEILINEFDYKFIFIPIDFDTRGASETILVALNNMTEMELNQLTIILDSDNLYNKDIINDVKKINDNVIFYFEDTNDNPIFSYININENNLVTEIKEKNKISNNACLGAYGFKNGNILKNYIIKTIQDNFKTNNEFYVSSIYNTMLMNNETIKSILSNNYICLGTPNQLKIFSSNINNNTDVLRICFDLDNTLVSYPIIKGDYTTVQPIEQNINYLKFLKKMGHTIIIHTARRMKTHNGDVEKVIQDIGEITINTLKEYDIPYDELHFGKPFANFYIDDLAVKSYDELDKELGFYNIHPDTRYHNRIEISGDKIIKYSNSINGESYWYKNIPNKITNYFPKFIDFSPNSLTLEKINGIPISYLNTHKTLTKKNIINTLDTLNFIHNSEVVISDINLYDNYTKKIEERSSSFDFSNYPDSDILINELKEFFINYELENRGIKGVIHGDPVFTNILIDNFDNLKFIDMRGKIGNVLTIYGDILYDYGKIYQSIIGYDFILMNTPLDYEYINNNKRIFEDYIITKFNQKTLNDIKWITKSLILTLIPLHNNSNCLNYYSLINTII